MAVANTLSEPKQLDQPTSRPFSKAKPPPTVHRQTEASAFSLGIILTVVALSLAFAPLASPASDWELRLSTNNDLFVNNSVNDDFYTFGGGIEFSIERLTVRWQENAFTHQADGFRFDESFLPVGGLAPKSWLGEWSLWLEAGAAHVGEGVLGQSVQNDVHELIGDDPVALDYLSIDDYHAHAEVQVARPHPWSFLNGNQVFPGRASALEYPFTSPTETSPLPRRPLTCSMSVPRPWQAVCPDPQAYGGSGPRAIVGAKYSLQVRQ